MSKKSCVIWNKKVGTGEKLNIIVDHTNCADIKKIGFRYSDIFEVPTELFAKFQNLEVLDMNNQNIQVISPGTFENAVNLKDITLTANKIRILDADTFKGADNLKTVDLSSNLLESLPEEIFRTLRNLEDIDLSSNFLTFIPANLFESNKLVSRINFEKNKIQLFSIETFMNLTELLELNLRDNICINWSFRKINVQNDMSMLEDFNNTLIVPKMLPWYDEFKELLTESFSCFQPYHAC